MYVIFSCQGIGIGSLLLSKYSAVNESGQTQDPIGLGSKLVGLGPSLETVDCLVKWFNPLLCGSDHRLETCFLSHGLD